MRDAVVTRYTPSSLNRVNPTTYFLRSATIGETSAFVLEWSSSSLLCSLFVNAVSAARRRTNKDHRRANDCTPRYPMNSVLGATKATRRPGKYFICFVFLQGLARWKDQSLYCACKRNPNLSFKSVSPSCQLFWSGDGQTAL